MTISRSLSQMAWWLSFIHFTWASNQRQPLTMLTRGLYPLVESFSCHPDSWILHVWTRKTMPWGWFQIRVSCILPQFVLGWLITTMVSGVPSVMLFSALRGTCTIAMQFQWHLGWFLATLQCDVPTAGFSFSGFDMGLLSRLIIGCIIERVILLWVLGINKGPNKWTSFWGCTNKGNIWQGKDWGWSLRMTCRTARRGQGFWALGLWSKGDCQGICSWLHGSSLCLTQVMYGNHTRTGCGGDTQGY